ncbi:MAG: TasA family protein [Microgenomates group bacterium]
MKIKKKMLITGLFVLLLGLTVGAGAVFAYFTTVGQTDFNTIRTGRLDVLLGQTTTLEEQNWLPGESHVIEWSALNTGNIDSYLKGVLDVTWDLEGLDTDKILIDSVEYFDAGQWHPLTSNTISPGDEFLYSTDGTEIGLISFPRAKEVLFRMSIKLDPSVENEYQNAIFSGQIKMAGRQQTEGAEWGSF